MKQHAVRGGYLSSKKGFTIVELLVVIVVIAILAALVVVGYNGISRSAREASVKTDVKQGASQLEQEKVVDSQYPASCVAAGVQVSEDNDLNCTVGSSGSAFCLNVSYDDISYYATNRNLNPQAGTCSGTNGVGEGGQYVAVAAHYNSTCALSGSNELFCWGANGSGQLGNGSTTSTNSPVAVNMAGVLAGKTVESLAGSGWSYFHFCVVASGEPICWGNNLDGQLGNASTTSSSNPVAVDMTGVLAGKTVQKVALGGYHTCAIADGDAYCWGGNNSGQLGDGTTTNSNVPVAVATSGVLSGKTVTDISAGPGHTCVVADGAPFCWGQQTSYGVLGDGSTGGSSPNPVAVTTSGVLSGKTVTSIAAGEYSGCVLADGAPYCWGRNSNGELGNGNFTNSLAPVATTTSGVLSGKTITQLTGGAYYSCVLADDAPFCWGDNGFGGLGTLGNGLTVDSNVPVAVVTSGALSGVTVTQVDGGLYHACAYGEGAVYCWGSGTGGQLGNGSSVSASIPVLSLSAP